ncbi:MAG: phosphoenolpyruvate--protein phosphotransferase [Bauldia sp.]|uniref:phosphoenolpyruvate--protein phosphotransferase n=1 Tax=Bauldia sp. TaxID=2575872 RepID=UPI001D2C1B2C|nr:phosphoenolpyruvate--protein phosphotransferase [Bauldia sp.]MCB1494988.1 phosphoenolpyruvate--protein phosphotransferase [Bauldia sp.]
MRPAVERRGRIAAPGIAAGPVVRLDRPEAGRRNPSGDPARERADLEAAIATAIEAIAGLAAGLEGDAADILDFQIAMLEDDSLSSGAFAAIASGGDAVTAWSDAIAVQIADYEATADEYFRARAADLADIRDRVLRALTQAGDDATPPGAVLAGEDVTPSRFLSVDWAAGGGLALFAGSPSSHVAMLARSRGVPMVVGIGTIAVGDGDVAIVDGETGRIILNPGEADWAAYETARKQAAARAAREESVLRLPAVTGDGVAIRMMINVAEPEELDALDPAICDGIGLVRTEFLFHRPAGLPDEETQLRAYARIVEWADGRPVVLRTLDAGGDKPVAGLTHDDESNPFLGTRGIRLSLVHPDVFMVQLRAMARAAALGDVKVMLPMVTVPAEIEAAAALLDQAVADLTSEGAACRRPALGIMVEVPAVAIEPALYARADFFSIGSNDLTQYVTASARDTAAVSALNDAGHPAVASLIRNVVEAGAELGRDVSLCGDMASDPAHIPALVAAGMRTLSVAPALVGRAKLAIAETVAGSS